jgi:hypothetical protein
VRCNESMKADDGAARQSSSVLIMSSLSCASHRHSSPIRLATQSSPGMTRQAGRSCTHPAGPMNRARPGNRLGCAARSAALQREARTVSLSSLLSLLPVLLSLLLLTLLLLCSRPCMAVVCLSGAGVVFRGGEPLGARVGRDGHAVQRSVQTPSSELVHHLREERPWIKARS